MKEGWEYKKLGEVCTKGSSNISLNKIEENNGEYALFGASGYVKGIDFYHQDQSYIGVVKDGSGVGRVDIYPEKSSLVGTMQYIFPKAGCELGYLKYLLQGLHLEKYKTGAAIPHIYFRDYENCKVRVPKKEEQQKIVSELDLLSGVIEKHKAQLEELDKLAQSIFYDMFGDPVTNEKGWDKQCLKNICSKITDGTHNSPINEPEGKYKYITAKNIKPDGILLDNITYVNEDVHRIIYDRCNPVYGDILYIKDGVTTGIATINNLHEEFSLLSSVALLKPSLSIINYYLKYVLNYPSQYCHIRDGMGGAAITRLTIAKIEKISIPLPPLSLQQEFAAKVEAIEAMKAKVRQSLKEAETLFNERMDYYFN